MEKMKITPAALVAAGTGDIENMIAAMTPGGIEAQEAAGQKSFVASETLPKEMQRGCSREILESLGFVFGDDVDDIFVSVQFPEGWKKVATDHSMWSDLVDEKGRKRAAIFYKAAFYDRSAHMSISTRYRSAYQPEDNYESDISRDKRDSSNWYGVVYDGDEIIFKTDPAIKGINGPSGYEVTDRLASKAKAWLVENYPDYENCLAYWD